jgi:O-succinylbenzoic acid--CoA ligase
MSPPLYIHRYTLALRHGPANARSQRRTVNGFLVRCGDGFGCVHPWPELGDPTVEKLLGLLRGGQAHRLLARALECARHDGAARREGRSLFSAPIPQSHATVTGDADFAALAASGFTAVKLKTHGDDKGIVERVRAAADAGLRVRIDCNGTGIAALRALRPWADGIDFIEDPEPYAAARWQAMRGGLGMPLALDRHTGAEGAGFDVRVLKPAFDSMRPRAVPVVVTSYMDHPLGQLFAAWEASRYAGPQLDAGLLTHHLFEPDAFTEAVHSAGPHLFPAQGTGLGFDALLEALPWERLEGRAAVLLQNPRAPLTDAPEELPDGCLVFPTSGSTGQPSLVCLTPEAMMANATAVNDSIAATSDDVWLRVLPEFHVGGMSIRYRAALSGCRVVSDDGKWDAARFVRLLAEHGVTLTSLVPAQMFDLVSAGLAAPPSLRAVFVGGGKLEDSLRRQALALGWPVLPGYGMTEACSQIATARPDGDGRMELLPCWEARTDAAGRLQLRGAPLLSGRLEPSASGWKFEDACDADGWFTTADRVALEGRILTPLGRCGRVVKVLGELVDLDAVEAALASAGLPPDRGVVAALPDERAGVRPWLITDWPDAADCVEKANAALPPFARLAGWKQVNLPRSPLGKILRAELATRLAAEPHNS